MKELSIEEKARAYDEALKRARKINSGEGVATPPDWTICEVIFPELKESEDERIRKEIVEVFKSLGEGKIPVNLNYADIFTWLEKQGEQKPAVDIKVFIPRFRVGDIVKSKSQPMLSPRKIIAIGLDYYLCEDGGRIGFAWDDDCELVEQKPANQPKFNIGEWVIFNNRSHDSVYQIEKIENYQYTLRHILGGSMPLSFSNEKLIRHWNIEDAKNGDVLTDGKMIVIFKFEEPSYRQYIIIIAYIGLDSGGYIQITDDTWRLGIDKAKPATKEQRDLLFSKMKEAGYEWDADKKELKKMITPIFNIGDTIIKKHNSDINKFGQFTITNITGGKYWYNDRIICDISEQYEWELVEQKPISFDASASVSYDNIIWGAKDYELHEATYFIPKGFYAEIEGDKVIIKRGEQKPAEWSEKDEKMFMNIYNTLEGLSADSYAGELKLLKSLKDRVQPKQEWSDKDEYQFNTILHGIDLKKELYKKEGNAAETERYQRQYIWLKSLKDRVQPQPKVGWNEDDENKISSILYLLHELNNYNFDDWLKSFKYRN